MYKKSQIAITIYENIFLNANTSEAFLNLAKFTENR